MADYTAGFRYLFGIHMGVCRGPVDELIEVRVGDRTAWTGNVTANQAVQIDAYNLFGGEDGEGGVQGTMNVMFGEDNQLSLDALDAITSGSSSNRPLGSVVFPESQIYQDASNSDPNTLPRVCGIEFQTDGTTTVNYHGNVTTDNASAWFASAPVNPTVTADYEVKFDQVQAFGSATVTGTFGTWLPMNAARGVAISAGGIPSGNPFFLKMTVTFRKGTVQNNPIEVWLMIEQSNDYGGGA